MTRIKHLSLLFCVAAGTHFSAYAYSDPILKVEVDWVITMNDPDLDNSVPQFSLVVSPFKELDAEFGEVILNLGRDSNKKWDKQGGLTVRCWDGTTELASNESHKGLKLKTPGEQIFVTQSIRLENGNFISSLASSTSASFGNISAIECDIPTLLTDLDQFSLKTCVNESGVTAGRSRVQSIVLTQCRVHHYSGLIETTDVQAVVHSALVGTIQSSLTVDATGDLVPSGLVGTTLSSPTVDSTEPYVQ